ncbi:uncharacterized protein LOC143219640 [Lasioglossum baleicum]|uniref:uncharacterized protein LOC143219640 n=1 Tax=Lasioglossum baleicum TaxID=434251 RepID=UPI003FCEC4E5
MEEGEEGSPGRGRPRTRSSPRVLVERYLGPLGTEATKKDAPTARSIRGTSASSMEGSVRSVLVGEGDEPGPSFGPMDDDRASMKSQASSRTSGKRPASSIVMGDSDEEGTKRPRGKGAPSIQERQLDLRDLLPGEIAAEVVAAGRLVEATALKSGNLKGTAVRALKDAARLVEAGMRELVSRGWQGASSSTSGGGGAPSGEGADKLPVALWASVQAENRALRGENAALKRELGGVRDTLAVLKTELMAVKQRQAVPMPLPGASPLPLHPGAVDPPDKAPLPSSSGPAPTREAVLLARIGALMDAKLMALREEFRSVSGDRYPPSTAGTRSKIPAPSSSSDGPRPLDFVPPEGTWSEVVGRKERRKAKATSAQSAAPAPKGGTGHATKAPPRVAAPPRSAAVTITVPVGSKATYEEAIRRARQGVDLGALGIETLQWKRAVTGGLIIQVSGADGGAKADALAAGMTSALRGMEVRVARPVKKAEFRLTGLDLSVTPQEVVGAVARAGGCTPESVKVGTIKIPTGGLGTIWVQCPAVAALAIEKAKTCYRCGDPSHGAAACQSAPRCVVCAGAGRPANHKAGSKACSPPSKKKGSKGGGCVARSSKDKDMEVEPTQGVGGNSASPAVNESAVTGVVLQANLNNCRRAQDLMVQRLAELEVGLAVAAEPYEVPDHPQWFGDLEASVAIWVRQSARLPPFSGVERSRGAVLVKWGRLLVAGCYCSPNCGSAEFEAYLDRLRDMVTPHLTGPVLVLGDLNARSTSWGNPRTEPRGGILEDWMEGLELRLLNRSSVPTCMRWNGWSVVDVSLATASASRRVSNWRVWEGETLSDHSYVMMDVAVDSDPPADTALLRRSSALSASRWATKRLDGDLLRAVIIGSAWPPARERGPEEGAAWFRGALQMICDAAMPRVRACPPRKSVYWWSGELAELRSLAGQARRRYVRARRRHFLGGDSESTVDGLYREYRSSAEGLKHAITAAKAKAWSELLLTLRDDPWGRPYRMVLGKLRPRAPPVAETMEPEFLGRVVDTLFPPNNNGGEESGERAPVPANDWSDELRVSDWELDQAIQERRARGKKAPGPDGVPGGIMASALKALAPAYRSILDACLSRGVFPKCWKEEILVLLHKDGIKSTHGRCVPIVSGQKIFRSINSRTVRFRIGCVCLAFSG